MGPAVNAVLETCLYAEDLERVGHFYEEVFGWQPMTCDARLRSYGVSQGSVLLLFKKGATREAVVTPGGVIPAHDGVPGGHLAFSIAAQDWETWLQRLGERSISIEKIVRWPRGGQSLYFRDPDGNLVELATPGLWAVY
jgi:catechol 2,3-dioxygenase-like lactoylglutathione lyase family enzyme